MTPDQLLSIVAGETELPSVPLPGVPDAVVPDGRRFEVTLGPAARTVTLTDGCCEYSCVSMPAGWTVLRLGCEGRDGTPCPDDLPDLSSVLADGVLPDLAATADYQAADLWRRRTLAARAHRRAAARGEDLRPVELALARVLAAELADPALRETVETLAVGWTGTAAELVDAARRLAA